jgi:hypothetical protein
MASFVYIFVTIVTLLCCFLLLRAYLRVRLRLLLWSAVCFAGLTIANGLVFVDLVMIPDVSLYPLRLATAALAMLVLLYGLIWESDRS